MEKSVIMEQNRHMFIYGPNGLDRQEFLKQLEIEYPIKINEYSPMAIYMKNLNLLTMENKHIDKSKLGILTREYLISSIAYQIIETIFNQVDIELLENKVNELLSWVEKRQNDNYSKIDDLKELIEALRICKEIYYEAYTDYLKSSKVNIDFEKLPIIYLDIERFVYNTKHVLNNKGYFNIIIDQQEQFPLELQSAINWLVTKRINGNISMKIFCEKDDWKTYYDLNGITMDYCHDYGTYEIEDFSKILKI